MGDYGEYDDKATKSPKSELVEKSSRGDEGDRDAGRSGSRSSIDASVNGRTSQTEAAALEELNDPMPANRRFSPQSNGATSGAGWSECTGYDLAVLDDQPSASSKGVKLGGYDAGAAQGREPAPRVEGQVDETTSRQNGDDRQGHGPETSKVREERVEPGDIGRTPVSKEEAVAAFKRSDVPLEKAKEYANSFDWESGEVTARVVNPGEKFFRYADHTLEGDVRPGRFLTKDDYSTSPEAIEGSALDYWNPSNLDYWNLSKGIEGAGYEAAELRKLREETNPEDINLATIRQELTAKEPCVVLEGPIKGGTGTQSVLVNSDDYSKFDVSEPHSYGVHQAYTEEWRASRRERSE